MLFTYVLIFVEKNAALLKCFNNEHNSLFLGGKKGCFFTCLSTDLRRNNDRITSQSHGNVVWKGHGGACCPAYPSKCYYPQHWFVSATGLFSQVLKTSKCIHIIHGQPVPVLHPAPGEVSPNAEPEPPNP